MCQRQGVIYHMECLECREQGKKTLYVGESSRSGYDRGVEHLRAVEADSEESPLVEHRNLKHQNKAVRFEMILKEFPRTTLQRQAGEAHHIELNMPKAEIINRRGEWGQNLPPKLVLEDDNNKEGKRKTRGRATNNQRPGKRQRPNDQQEGKESTAEEESVITGNQGGDPPELGAAAVPLVPEVSPPENKGATKMTGSGKSKKLSSYRDRQTKGQENSNQIKRSKPVVKGRDMLTYMERIKSQDKEKPRLFASEEPTQENATLDVQPQTGEKQRQESSNATDKTLSSMVKKVSLGQILASQSLSPQQGKSKVGKGRKGGVKTKGKYVPNPGLLAQLIEQNRYKGEEPTGRHIDNPNLNRAVLQENKPEEDLGQVRLKPNRPG